MYVYIYELDKINLNKYRPISQLPVFSKLLERVVLINNDILAKNLANYKTYRMS